MLKEMLNQKATMVPTQGYRLVGLDDFEPPGEQLYEISAHATGAEAEAARAAHVAARGASNDDPLFIYGPDDR